MIPVIVRVQDGSRTGSQFVDGIFSGQIIVGGFVSIRKQMPQVYEDPRGLTCKVPCLSYPKIL